jgi:signal transduction histidine kinase
MGITGMVRLPQGWRGAAGVAVVTLLTVIGCWVEANPVHSYGGLHLTRHPPLAAYLLVAAPALALVWRDRRPVAVFAVAVAGAVAWAGFGQIDGAALVPVLVALFFVALARPRRTVLVAGLAGAVAIFVTEGTLGPFGWLGGPNATMWPELLAAAALGGYVAARRGWAAAEADRAARAAQAREEDTRRRVDAERMRIARELHDVVAHSMAMINVQATAAGMLLTDDPAAAASAIQAIRTASKAGLRELRAILQVLRQADHDAPGTTAPGLTAIRALAEAATAAGTPTTVHAPEPAVAVPPPVALAAYRIVQESLTNVVRHADRAAATVTVRHAAAGLLVEIVNDGAPAATAFDDGAGAGLAGMRERAAALGGTLHAGPRPGGGYAVRACLPLTTATTGTTTTAGTGTTGAASQPEPKHPQAGGAAPPPAAPQPAAAVPGAAAAVPGAAAAVPGAAAAGPAAGPP